MKIIGAGFGRTGTLSIKSALEELGFGPCYHMIEVFKYRSHPSFWLDAAQRKVVDWDRLLHRYESGVDFPISIYYKELMEAYPDAKVLLSVRPSDRWYNSTNETTYPLYRLLPRWFSFFVPPLQRAINVGYTSIWNGVFKGRFKDRDYAIQVYEDHIEEVKRHVPPERLLVFWVKDGWEPLCEFLGVPVPDKPFPHENNRTLIKRGLTALRVVNWVVPLAFFALVVYGLWWLLFLN